MNSSAFTTIVMLSLLINLFVFIASSELANSGLTYDNSQQPLSNYVDLTDSDNVDTGDGVPININEQTTGISSGLGFVDWLSKIWGFVTGIFKFFFSIYYLMIDVGLNSALATLFGIPIGLAQMFGVFAFIRGVAS